MELLYVTFHAVHELSIVGPRLEAPPPAEDRVVALPAAEGRP